MDEEHRDRMGAASVLVEVRDLIEADRHDEALRLARTRIGRGPATSIPFHIPAGCVPAATEGSRVPGLDAAGRTRVQLRDGFVDRLSPERWKLVYSGALRVIDLTLPGALDTRVSAGTIRSYRGNSPIWWDLWPTVDHVIPRAGSGTNNEDNLLCVSWWRNAAKGAMPLEQIGWPVHEPGDPAAWDGLLGWFVDRVDRFPDLAVDPMVASYLRAVDPTARALEERPPNSPTLRTKGDGGPARTATSTRHEPPRETARPVDHPQAAAETGTTRPSRCRKDVWERNTRGAYHTHDDPSGESTWLAGNGLWRVVTVSDRPRRYRLERLVGERWVRFETGTNSDDLLATAARVDAADGVPERFPGLRCWRGRSA